MIDRNGKLSICAQAKLLGISRGSVYYLPPEVSQAERALMRQMDELHLERKRSANPSFINEGKLRLSRHRKLTNEGIAEWIENELSAAWRRSGRTGALA